MVELCAAAPDVEERFAAVGAGGGEFSCLPVQSDAVARQVGLASLFAGNDVADTFRAQADAAAVGIGFRGKVGHQIAVLRLDADDVGYGGAACQIQQDGDEGEFHIITVLCFCFAEDCKTAFGDVISAQAGTA
ncbi:hypothetical protein HMPREF9120_01461 [Neisseria sp. oral taxon 020 str. F0370]|nr:hypothetical protein HMPREF9120_01461 [Neisseria sp. oral taxon 020 str. F0370]